MKTTWTLKALIIENIEDDALLIADALNQDGFDVSFQRVDTANETRRALTSQSWDIVFADYTMPGFTAIDALKIYAECQVDTPFIIVSGSIGEDIAVEAMRHGANDYVLKDRLVRLPAAVRRELREAENRRQKRAAELERVRQAEELAERAEQLYRSNKDLERFAYVAAHDLQEPLRNVAIYSQVLARRYSGQDDDTDVVVGYITEGARRMEALIQGILAYSRITHEPEQHLVTVDSAEVLQSVLSQSRIAIDEARCKITSDPLPKVTADSSHLSSVLQNLLSNAIKYRRQDTPSTIHVSAMERNKETIFSVSDNGIGIPEEHLEHVFLIVRRLHRNTEIPGLGVGLALARRLVENHGGRIWAESEAGQGSTFFFTIPRRPADLARQSG